MAEGQVTGVGGNMVSVNNVVQQNGIVTPSHLAIWTTDGVIQDGGVIPSGGGGTGNGVVDWINVKDAPYGATGNGVTDDSVAINSAVAAANGRTVYLPAGTYRVNHQLSLSNSLTFQGDGRGSTFLLIDQAFDPAASSVILCTTIADYGVTIRDLAIVFVQPSTVTTRSTFLTLAAGGTSGTGGTGVQYPWAIWGPNGSGRIKVQNVQVRGAWNGFLFDTVFWIDNIEMGAAGTGFATAQNAAVLDFCFIGTYEHWPYGWNTTGQANIFLDGQTIAIQCGNAANPSFQAGFQGQSISNLGSRIIFHASGWSTITNLNNDSDMSSLEVYGAQWLEITNFYYTAGTGPVRPAIQGIGTDGPARLFIHNMYAHSSANYPLVTVSGISEVHILGFFLIYYTLGVSAMTVSSGILRLGDGHLAALGTKTVPVIDQTGGSLIISDGVEIDGGTGVAVQLATDAGFIGRLILGTGFTIVLPPTITNGYYYGYSDIVTTGGLTVGGAVSMPSSTVTVGQLFVGNGGGQHGIYNNGGDGLAKTVQFQTASLNRWIIVSDTSAESGANAGSNFYIARYSDSGSPLGNPIGIVRSTGQLLLADLQASTSYANDAAAATGGVPVGGVYRNGSIVQVRIT